ncbi:cysteine dioxygenase [Streptomyces sp. NPDC048001]|uniref:cysteine dioxygenase family protein n=1 Tax=unclassified Streptomyces TaxID=2593676 RepID=UPI003715F1D3
MTTLPSAYTAPRLTPRAERLIEDVRRAVRPGLCPDGTARAAGEALAPHLGERDLLTDEQRQGDPRRYRQHLLHAEHDGSFSLVALVWLPGQGTSVHDHVAWCTTGVHEGEERERRYRLVPGDGPSAPAHLLATAEAVNHRGEVCGFAPPGDIHRVWNAGPGTALSLHVYGADISRLGTSVRRVYDLPADR